MLLRTYVLTNSRVIILKSILLYFVYLKLGVLMSKPLPVLTVLFHFFFVSLLPKMNLLSVFIFCSFLNSSRERESWNIQIYLISTTLSSTCVCERSSKTTWTDSCLFESPSVDRCRSRIKSCRRKPVVSWVSPYISTFVPHRDNSLYIDVFHSERSRPFELKQNMKTYGPYI